MKRVNHTESDPVKVLHHALKDGLRVLGHGEIVLKEEQWLFSVKLLSIPLPHTNLPLEQIKLHDFLLRRTG